jgi:hypothetical protein
MDQPAHFVAGGVAEQNFVVKKQVIPVGQQRAADLSAAKVYPNYCHSFCQSGGGYVVRSFSETFVARHGKGIS